MTYNSKWIEPKTIILLLGIFSAVAVSYNQISENTRSSTEIKAELKKIDAKIQSNEIKMMEMGHSIKENRKDIDERKKLTDTVSRVEKKQLEISMILKQQTKTLSKIELTIEKRK